MLEINYKKIIPYSFEVVLGQYFDYEHIKFVHPRTLGEYRLVESNGDTVLYEQLWPKKFFRQPKSLVEQKFLPPNEIRFTFIKGHLRGVKVQTFIEKDPRGSLVNETFFLPRLPNWRGLRPLVRPMIVKSVNRIWEEDLKVEVCYGGWPGVPQQNVAES